MISGIDKQGLYSSLVRQRKLCRACSGLINPAESGYSQYDSLRIGPWSRWQGNLNARLMVVGQDWGDVKAFVQSKGLYDPKNPTNLNLIELLKSIGINIPDFDDYDRSGQIFLTNAILCMKGAGLQSKVEDMWYENCGKRFLRPTIEIIKPAVVVALGEVSYKAILHAYGIRYSRPKLFRLVVESIGRAGGLRLSDRILVFPVYHCGNQGVNRNRKLPDQIRDWQPIRKAMDDLDSQISAA